MTPTELRSTCIEIFGKRGWQIGCARFLKRPDGSHVNVRTVRRWSSGKTLVPVAVAMILTNEAKKEGATL